MVLDGERAAGGRRESDVHDIAAHELQRANDDAVEHRARDATVPPNDDPAGIAARDGPCAEGGRIAGHDLRGEGVANATPDPRHADHQPASRCPRPSVRHDASVKEKPKGIQVTYAGKRMKSLSHRVLSSYLVRVRASASGHVNGAAVRRPAHPLPPPVRL